MKKVTIRYKRTHYMSFRDTRKALIKAGWREEYSQEDGFYYANKDSDTIIMLRREER